MTVKIVPCVSQGGFDESIIVDTTYSLKYYYSNYSTPVKYRLQQLVINQELVFTDLDSSVVY